MKLQEAQPNYWILEHDNILVAGETLEEVVIEYGLAMERRGLNHQKMSDEIKNSKVY